MRKALHTATRSNVSRRTCLPTARPPPLQPKRKVSAKNGCAQLPHAPTLKQLACPFSLPVPQNLQQQLAACTAQSHGGHAARCTAPRATLPTRELGGQRQGCTQDAQPRAGCTQRQRQLISLASDSPPPGPPRLRLPPPLGAGCCHHRRCHLQACFFTTYPSNPPHAPLQGAKPGAPCSARHRSTCPKHPVTPGSRQPAPGQDPPSRCGLHLQGRQPLGRSPLLRRRPLHLAARRR